jgi:hypothetical protein
MKLKSVASLKGPLACSIILILKTYFLSLTAMGCRPYALRAGSWVRSVRLRIAKIKGHGASVIER